MILSTIFCISLGDRGDRHLHKNNENSCHWCHPTTIDLSIIKVNIIFDNHNFLFQLIFSIFVIMDGKVLKLLTKIIKREFPNIDSIQIIETGYNLSKPLFKILINTHDQSYFNDPNLEHMIYSLFDSHMGDVYLFIYYEQ